jgi:hypothetical protein
MNRLLTILFIIFFSVFPALSQQNFIRSFEIPTLSYGEFGFGNIISGVDFDGDGLPEIYTCNTNSVDRPNELIPRLYKFELNPVTFEWDSVWCGVIEGQSQNTWPALATGDLDKDGKPEIYWAPVNYSPYPEVPRVFVFEYPGDGSDNMGVFDGLGGYTPNASTLLEAGIGVNLRPIVFKIADPDNDGTDELIFSDRQPRWFYGIVSVDDIPDNGGGLETWTIEASGQGDTTLAGSMYDVAVINNYVYLFSGSGLIYPIKYDSGNWVTLPALSNVAEEYGSFKGAVTIDLDNDGTDEIVLGGWSSPTKVFVLKQTGDSLQTFDVSDTLINIQTLNGAAVGDVDADGHPDFVFGTRGSPASVPNNAILRVEFQGGAISDANNYISSIVDSFLVPEPDGMGGQLDVISIGNVDGDPADEIIYTQGYTRGVADDTTANIAILDLQFTPVSVDKETDLVPDQFYLGQNFPNPFNPSTQIKFGITEAVNVDLRVYDILGSEVSVILNNEFLSAGAYNVKFDASKLASGVYVYKLTAGSNTISKKMQFLK